MICGILDKCLIGGIFVRHTVSCWLPWKEGCSMVNCNLRICRILVNIPSQANGRGTNHELVAKELKSGGSQSLSKDIGWLVTGGDKSKADVFVQDLFPNEMVINLYMLSPSMIDRVRGKSHGTKIVTQNNGRRGEGKMNVFE